MKEELLHIKKELSKKLKKNVSSIQSALCIHLLR